MSEHKAGPELDAMVAGLMEPKPPPECPEGGMYASVASVGGWWIWVGVEWIVRKHPSTDIAAAWEVWESPRHTGVPCLHRYESGYYALCYIDGKFGTAEAPTAPLAICLAALAACSSELDTGGRENQGE